MPAEVDTHNYNIYQLMFFCMKAVLEGVCRCLRLFGRGKLSRGFPNLGKLSSNVADLRDIEVAAFGDFLVCVTKLFTVPLGNAYAINIPVFARISKHVLGKASCSRVRYPRTTVQTRLGKVESPCSLETKCPFADSVSEVGH